MFKFWDTVLHNREGTHPILRQKEGFLLDWVDSKKDSENTTYYPMHIFYPLVYIAV